MSLAFRLVHPPESSLTIEQRRTPLLPYHHCHSRNYCITQWFTYYNCHVTIWTTITMS